MFGFASEENKETLKNALKSNTKVIYGVGKFVSERVDDKKWKLAVYKELNTNEYYEEGDIWNIKIYEQEFAHIEKKGFYKNILVNIVLILLVGMITVCFYVMGTGYAEAYGSILKGFIYLFQNPFIIFLLMLAIICLVLLKLRNMLQQEECKLIDEWFKEIGILEENDMGEVIRQDKIEELLND